MLSNQWIVPNFYPIAYLPRGVRLTAYGGGSGDLPAEVLQRYLDRLAVGDVSLVRTAEARWHIAYADDGPSAFHPIRPTPRSR